MLGRYKNNNNYRLIETVCNTCGRHAAVPADAKIVEYVANNNVPMPLSIECKECMEGRVTITTMRPNTGVNRKSGAIRDENMRNENKQKEPGNETTEPRLTAWGVASNKENNHRGNAGDITFGKRGYKIGWCLAMGGLSLSTIDILTSLSENMGSLLLWVGVIMGLVGMLINLKTLLQDPKAISEEATSTKVFEKLHREGQDAYMHSSYSNMPGNIWHSEEDK
jgi:hypothetical protein